MMRVLLIDDEGRTKQATIDESQIIVEQDAIKDAKRELIDILPDAQCRRCVTKRFIKVRGNVLTEKGLPIFVLYDIQGTESDPPIVEEEDEEDEIE